MENEVMLVTGATDGIGKQTALELARIGAHVLLHGRNPTKGQAALDEIRKKSGSDAVELFIADLASQRQVRGLASAIQEKHDRLDVLIHNAGIFMKQRELTEDGYEVTFAVNHLAPFLLTHLLLDTVKKSAPARIVTVSSQVHSGAQLDFDNLQGEKSYSGYGAYSLSKLANVLFAFELAERLQGVRVTSNALHPGVINTNLLRAGWGGGGGGLEEGASTSVYLATAPEVENVTGRYFVRKQEARSSPLADDKTLRERFWQLSEKMVGIE